MCFCNISLTDSSGNICYFLKLQMTLSARALRVLPGIKGCLAFTSASRASWQPERIWKQGLNKSISISKGIQANQSSYLLNSGTLGECNCLADEGSQLDWKSSVDWNEAPDLLGIVEPEPERLGEPAEKVNMVNIKEELGKPVVERLVCLAHVLREHWDDGHLSNLLYYPGNGLLPKYTSKRTCF